MNELISYKNMFKSISPSSVALVKLKKGIFITKLNENFHWFVLTLYIYIYIYIYFNHTS